MSNGFGDLFATAQEGNTNRVKGLPKGSHIVALTSVRVTKTRSKGRMAEFRYMVVNTNNPEVNVGDEYGEVYYPEDTSNADLIESNRGRLRALVRAIAGLPSNVEAPVFNEAWEAMSGDGQAARGAKLRCMGSEQVSKKGNQYVAVSHESISQTDEDVVATRAWIESGGTNTPTVSNTTAALPPGIAARIAQAKA